MRDPSNNLQRQLEAGLLEARFFCRKGSEAAGIVLRRTAALLVWGVSIAGATVPVFAQTDQTRVSIAAPTLAAGDGGHLFEIEGAPKSAEAVAGGAWVLTRTGDGTGELTVNVTVAEVDGDFVPAGMEGSQEVTFADGETTVQYRPISDDSARESHGTVTVVIAAGDGYEVDSNNASAAVAVRDDDERMEYTVEPLNLSVVEGEAAQFRAVLRTTDPTTFTEAGDVARVLRSPNGLSPGGMVPFDLTWLTKLVEAESLDDYQPVSGTFRIAASEFVADGNGYAARKNLQPIQTLTDMETEGPERLLGRIEPSATTIQRAAVAASRANVPDLIEDGSVVSLSGGRSIAAVLTITDPQPSGDATLSGLTLTVTDTGNAVELDPQFASNEFNYSAEVPVGVQNVTLEATANHAGATLKYMNGKEGTLSDADPDTDGIQVGLILGGNIVKVQVEAENGMKQIYAVSVTRPGPPLSLAVDTIAGDDVVNIQEKAEGFAISGSVRDDKMAGMDDASVTVDIAGETLTATSGSDGTWSVDVPAAADYVSESSVAVTFNATKPPFLPAPEIARELAVDLTPPALVAAEAEETLLTLKYDELLGENGVTPSAFSVTVNEVVLPDPMPVAVGNGTVVLGLPSALALGDTVTVSYTAPSDTGGKPIRDVAGNPAASLTDHPVANGSKPGERCAGADGSMRLADGADSKEGRVEVCADDDTTDATPARWGTVCDDYWTNDDADVMCKALDFERSEPHAGRFRKSYFGAGTGPIWLDDLLCDGDESSLLDCMVASGRRARDTIGVHNCKVTEIVGVRCMAAGDPLKPHVVSGPEVTHPGADVRYEPGDTLRVTMTFNEAVVVDSSGGTPTVDLYLGSGSEPPGRSAPLVDGSGTKLLGFEYRVASEDGSFDELRLAADSLATNGGTIRNADSLDAILAHGSAVEPLERFLQSPTLSVSDATAREGAQLRFEVSLSYPAATEVSVSYGTEEGTATAGTDYETTSGTLTFTPGATAGIVSVVTLDDAHDDDGETLILTLSDARGARIAEDTATGTIANSDPMPQAWLARFGRTAASHAVEAIDARLRGSEGEHIPGGVNIAGRDWLGDWSAWGRTASTRFDGVDGFLSLNGEVTTATLGLDSRRGRWLAGAAVAYSQGDGVYDHETAAGGVVTSTLASLHPYASYRIDERLSLWGVLGYGVGELTLQGEGAETSIETGLASTMAAFGGRGVLRPASGGLELAVVSDALWTNTVSEATRGLMRAEGEALRLRLALEGSGSFAMPGGGELKPRLEAGVRYDAGDAENGTGVELGGGLAYIAGRLSAQVDARALLAHQDEDYEEWGFSGSVRWQPDERGHGWSMNLGSSWGVPASGVDSMWCRPTGDAFAHDAASNAAQRFEAELGYGLAGHGGGSLWYPFVGTSATEDGAQAVRMGVRLTSGANLSSMLEVGRRMHPGGRSEDAIGLRGAMRW